MSSNHNEDHDNKDLTSVCNGEGSEDVQDVENSESSSSLDDNDSTTSNQTFTRQGSLRKVLTSEHNKDYIFGRQNEDVNNFYKVVRQEYVILAEYKMVISENIRSIYVIPSRENSFVWFGVIFVRSGLYEDGVFRFNLVLPDLFPDSEHPKVIFESEVFHPVINASTGELNLLKGFPVWNKTDQHVWQIIKYISWVFYNFEGSVAHAVNKEAVDLYKENFEAFKEKVKESVRKSQEELYNPPPNNDIHYITFEKYNPEVHDPVRTLMLDELNTNQRVAVGHSWVSPDSFKPLSRPPSPTTETIS